MKKTDLHKLIQKSLASKIYNIKCKPNQMINPETLRCISKNGKIAQDILNELNTLHMPFSIQKNSIITEHPGSSENIHFGMVYLAHKYKNDCVVFPTIHNQKITVKIDDSKTHSIISVPDGYWASFLKCNTGNKRFIISPLTLTRNIKGKNIYHANYLIYDSLNNVLERFEPHGFNVNFQGRYIDTIVKQTFQHEIKDLTYIGNEQFCPYYGYQRMEFKEGNKLKTDPSGFCAAWSLFYADLRLGNPTKTRDEIILLGFQLIKNNFDTLKNFIRDYSDFFIQMRKKYQKGYMKGDFHNLDDFFISELKN